MHYKLVDKKPKTFVLVFETNDELRESYMRLRPSRSLLRQVSRPSAHFRLGKLGWLNWETKQYEPSVSLDEQVELVSLIGDIAFKDGEPQVHARGRRISSGMIVHQPSGRSITLMLFVF
jgi:uncharacterized protein